MRYTGSGGDGMTITQMRYFLEVCKQQGNVTRAAETLHISQPSVSNALRDMESEFSVSLFHRVKMRLSLTKEGELFQSRCQKVMAEVDSLQDFMKDLGNKHNQIRIGVPPMIGTFLFPSIFEGFRRMYPDIQIELAEHGSRTIWGMIENEELDIGIAIADSQIDALFHTRHIVKSTLDYAVDQRHEMAGRKSIRLEELDGKAIVQFQRDSQQTIVLNECFSRLHIQPNVLLASSQLYTIKKIISYGQAGAFLFREITAQDPAMIGVPLEEPIDLDICLIWKRGRRMLSDSFKLIRFVQDLFCQM